MSKEIITELEVLFTANTQQVDKAAKGVHDQAQKIERTPVEQKVEGDAKGALAAMDRVEAEAKKIVSAKTMATVEANIKQAETSLTKVQERLDYLRSVEGTMEVTADIKKAEFALKQIERRRDGLVSARESMVIDADTAPAEAALKDIADEAGDAGAKAGDDAGQGLSGGIIAAIATIPIAGAIVGIGAAIGKSLLDGLQNEVRTDRLMATTGLDAATVGRLARAAGEAYAGNFGESLEANMDTAREALRGGLIDPTSTARDTQAVIEQLAAVADILETDVATAARTAGQMIRTGLAKDGTAALDLLVIAAQRVETTGGDIVEVFGDSAATLKQFGLDGRTALGLFKQAADAGAPSADFLVGALEELAGNAGDSIDVFDALGLSGIEMSQRLTGGGAAAAEGLGMLLQALRDTEDPAARTTALVGLFGEEATAMQEALLSLDLSTAVAELGAVEGAAKSAIDALGDNAAGDIASAQRNIEVAADGIKGALAAAFNPQIEGFAEFVSENREAVITFLLEIANGGLDMGRSIVNGVASGTEAVGAFISGPIADLIQALGDLAFAVDDALIGDQGGLAARDGAHAMAESLRGVEVAAGDLADEMRTNLIENGINPAQDKLNEIAIPLVAQAALRDATVALANDIDGLGVAADGSTVSMQGLDTANLTASASGQLLDAQLRAVTEGMDAQIIKGFQAGETQESLTEQYHASREALLAQLEAMGLTETQAEDLITQYGLIPDRVSTVVDADTFAAKRKLETIRELLRMPSVVVGVDVNRTGYYANRARGSIDVKALAHGAVFGAPLGTLAEKVAPGTLRVAGDRLDVPESFIPWDGSPRSWALLMETFRGMPGVMPMGDGAVLGTGGAPASIGGGGGPLDLSDRTVARIAEALHKAAREAVSEAARDVRGAAMAWQGVSR